MNSKRSHKPRAAIKDEAVFVGATTTRRGYMSQVHSQLDANAREQERTQRTTDGGTTNGRVDARPR